MKVKIYNKDATSFEERDFSNVRIFEGDKGVAALHQVIKAYQANLRQGNACTKDRGAVSGSGKKPYRQKGTGNARHGEKRSPIWTKGGVVFGPKPRDYSQKINKNVKLLAFQRAIFDAIHTDGLALIEAMHITEPKTKNFNALVKNLNRRGRILIVDTEFNDNAILSARNLPYVDLMYAQNLNALNIVNHAYVLVSQRAFEYLLERSAA